MREMRGKKIHLIGIGGVGMAGLAVLLKARGADGRQFLIKKDVNLLRGYTETDGSSSSSATAN